MIKVAVLGASFGVTSAFADVGSHKEPLRVDFNQMIEQGAQDNQALQRGVLEAAQPTTDTANEAAVPAPAAAAEVAVATPTAQPAPPTETAATNRRAVIDFIDMEVGVGNDAAVVDSRSR